MSPLTSYVVETLVTLVAIVALAVLVLYAARRMGGGRQGGPLELVGRLPLDGRRAVYLVRVGKTVYVVGASEAGLAKLGELPGEGLELHAVETPSRTFSEALARALARRDAWTRAHSGRVSVLAVRMAKRLGLPEEGSGSIARFGRRIGALVILDCVLDPQGRIASVQVLRGHPLFDLSSSLSEQVVFPRDNRKQEQTLHFYTAHQ